MKKLLTVLTVLIIVGICIPAVSAENYVMDLTEYSYYHSTGIQSGSSTGTGVADINYLTIINSDLLYGNDIDNVFLQTTSFNIANYAALGESGSTKVNIGEWGRATYGYFKYTVGDTNYLQIYLTDFEYPSGYPTGLSGETKYVLTPDDSFVFPMHQNSGHPSYVKSYELGIAISGDHDTRPYTAGTYFYSFSSKWENTLTIDTQPVSDEIALNRHGMASQIDILTSTINYSNTANTDYNVILHALTQRPYSVIVTNPISGKTFTYSINSAGIIEDDTSPDSHNVIVYIRNSQSGAAIANSRCVIDALVDGDYYPVVNRTEPSGIFSVPLQPTGGGPMDPDGYRLIASADGYINPLPEINFTVDEYTTSIYCYLDPIAGGPADENNTFIDFFVRDMSANPISGATINFGGYTMITNSAGYAVLEVGKNATYTYTVSKSGYGSLTGNAVIGADPRHTINTVLAPAVTPTTQTPIPTSTSITPTPTMTAPNGEPVSNWLEWFAAHFGMILGGGVEIGKIFMWLCFTVPVGVYVGKEAKSGAAGFMAGAGIVTLFFVLIGWVPLWLVVLLGLIIGLLYAKVFNTSDNGGGR